MIVLVLTRDQVAHVREKITSKPLQRMIDRVLKSHDVLPEPDDLLPAAVSLRHDGIMGVTFADPALADLAWDILKAQQKPAKKKEV